MRCQGYFPRLLATRDLYTDASGRKRPIYDDDKTFNSTCYHNGLLPLPASDGHIGLNSEAIKQKILEHEAVFRNQVFELHRLYRKQKELMNEVQAKQVYQNCRQRDTLQPNPISSQISCISTQKMQNAPNITWLKPASHGPSVSVPQFSQSHLLIKEGSWQADSNISHPGGSSKNSEVVESKCKKYQNKILDLELPATEYIDSDEGELFEVETASGVPSHNTWKLSGVFPGTDIKPVHHCGSLNSVWQGDSQIPNSSLRRTTALVDLNEPIQLEEATNLNSGEFVGSSASNRKTLLQELSGKTVTGVEVLSESNQNGSNLESLANILEMKKEKAWGWELCNDKIGKSRSNLNFIVPDSTPRNASTSMGALHSGCNRDDEVAKSLLADQGNRRLPNERPTPEMSERGNDLTGGTRLEEVHEIPNSGELICISNMGNLESFSVLSCEESVYDFKRIPIAVQALPCFNAPVPIGRKSSKTSVRSSLPGGEKTWLCKRSRTSASSLPSSPGHNSRTEMETDEVCFSSNRFNYLKFNGYKHIDLNSIINGDASSSTPSSPSAHVKGASEMVLKAPMSPENEECSPPRGESDENRLEIPLHLCKQENRDPLEDLVGLAAKALVSISSSGVCSGESADVKLCDTSPDNYLHWFAEVVFSVTGTLEDDFQINVSEKEEENSCDGFDYFEAMTLKLPETKVEVPYSDSIGKRVDESSSPPLPSPSRRGRARAVRKWKDFQTEILPCLASLSRHEVTEDLQTIEGLMMEAAGASRGSSSGRRRNGCSRSNRRSSGPRSAVAEIPACLVSKHHQRKLSEVMDIGERPVVNWGKITRRRRGPRLPATNLPLLSSQV